MKSLVLAAALAASACGPGIAGGPTMTGKINNDLPPPTSEVVSKEILDREPIANTAEVKHILISWKDLADAFDGRQDPRAQKRSKSEAEALIRALLDKIKKGEDFDALMRSQSEDPGSAASARAYPVTPDAKLVIEFRQLSLRLKVNEIGVCQSDFGFHIIKRLE